MGHMRASRARSLGVRACRLRLSLMVLIALWASDALADRPRVALCQSETADRQIHEIETRLRAELSAAGFDAVPFRAAGGTAESMEQAARDTGSLGAIAILRSPAIAADVWTTNPVSSKTLLRRATFDGAARDGIAVFVIRVVELLKASLLELEEAPSPPSTPTPSERGPLEEKAPVAAAQGASLTSAQTAPGTQVPPAKREQPPRGATPAPAPSRAPPRDRFEVTAGAVLVGGSSSLPWSVAPMLGASWRPAEHWATTIEIWAPALSHIERSEGAAHIDQEAASLYLELWPFAPARLRPFGRIGLGAYRLGAKGEPNPPYIARSGDAWAASGSAGIGARFMVVGSIVLLAGMDLSWLMPRPGVEFAGHIAASAARPLLIGRLGAGLDF